MSQQEKIGLRFLASFVIETCVNVIEYIEREQKKREYALYSHFFDVAFERGGFFYRWRFGKFLKENNITITKDNIVEMTRLIGRWYFESQYCRGYDSINSWVKSKEYRIYNPDQDPEFARDAKFDLKKLLEVAELSTDGYVYVFDQDLIKVLGNPGSRSWLY